MPEQILRLQAKGIRFCPASGRQYSSLRKLFAPAADQLFYICENGAAVFSPGRLLAQTAMERTAVMELCRDVLAIGPYEVVISGVNLSYLCPKAPDIAEHVRYVAGNRAALLNRPEDLPDEPVKVSAYCRQGAQALGRLLAPSGAVDSKQRQPAKSNWTLPTPTRVPRWEAPP